MLADVAIVFRGDRGLKQTFTKEAAITEIKRLSNEGWIAPIGASIKGYCTGFEGTKSRSNNHPTFGLFPARRYYKIDT
jgi:hypothetical protein